MNMIQLKLFLDHSDYILCQTLSLGIPPCDCCVLFDLRVCPMTVEVKSYVDACNIGVKRFEFEDTRSINNITCTYWSSGVSMQKFFPCEWLTKNEYDDID